MQQADLACKDWLTTKGFSFESLPLHSDKLFREALSSDNLSYWVHNHFTPKECEDSSWWDSQAESFARKSAQYEETITARKTFEVNREWVAKQQLIRTTEEQFQSSLRIAANKTFYAEVGVAFLVSVFSILLLVYLFRGGTVRIVASAIKFIRLMKIRAKDFEKRVEDEIGK
jgi:hypothetical protein